MHMNNLINQHFFHLILNEFITYDSDVIPWKFTCRSIYYYIHVIYIQTYILHCNYYIFPYLKITYVDLTLFYSYDEIPDYTYIEYYNDYTYEFINVNYPILMNYFDYDILSESLTHLCLYYKNENVTNELLYRLQNLTYLDLGIDSKVTDFTLPNLERLYLQNNTSITIKTILRHTKLKYLQLCRVYYFDEIYYIGIPSNLYKQLDYIDNIDCYIYLSVYFISLIEIYSIKNKDNL